MKQRTYRSRRPWRERLYSFMIGRNGADALSRALLMLYLVVFLVNLFVRSYIIYCLGYAIVIYSLFRMLSRNLPTRRRENAWYLRAEGKVRGFFKLQKNKWRDRKTHVFRKCPTCKSMLRLPRQKGKHTVLCPQCQHRFDIKI
ncbi:MAG: hypothetical protein IIX15_04275 [Clostridia bacterium]|nr:hypothetical protein [Clostridia bacterium]